MYREYLALTLDVILILGCTKYIWAIQHWLESGSTKTCTYRLRV